MAQVGSQNEPLHERALFGFDGALWRRLSLLWGYSSDKSEDVTNTSAAAGTNTLQGVVVPAGEVWTVEVVNLSDLNNAVTGYFIQIIVNGLTFTLETGGALAAGVNAVWSGKVTLSAGDRVQGVLTGCTLNDDIRLRYHATVMKVNL